MITLAIATIVITITIAIVCSSVKDMSGNKWFNIKHDDNSGCSVELDKDTLWRYEDDGKNDFYKWKWVHLEENTTKDETTLRCRG